MPITLPEEDNAAISFADWLTSLGNATRGAAAGKWGSAGRNLEDTVLDPIDAFLPGNVFKKRARPGDQTNFDELLGGMEPGVARSVTNIIGNTITDPLTILQATPAGRAVLPNAGRKAMNLAEKAPLVEKALYGLRKATGNQRKGKRTSGAMSAAQGKEAAVEEGWRAFVQEKLAPYDKKLRTTVFDTVQNVIPDGQTGKFKVLNEKHDTRSRYLDNKQQVRDAIERVKQHPDYASHDPKQVEAAIQDIYGISNGMFAQIGKANAWDMPDKVWRNKATGDLLTQDEINAHKLDMEPKLKEFGVTPDQYADAQFKMEAFDPETMSARDYLRRSIEVNDSGTKAISEKPRQLPTAKALTEFLNDPKNNVTKYERDALQAIAERIPGQGRILRRQTLSDELFPGAGPVGRRAGPDGSAPGEKLFKDAIDSDVASGKLTAEEADALTTMWKGIGDGTQPGFMGKVLDYSNNKFKQAAVYGILIPKFAGLFRNRLGTALQSLGAEGVPGSAAWNQFKTAVPDTFAAIIHDGFKLKMPKDVLTKKLNSMEAAIQIGGGRVEKAAAHLRSQGENRLADALELGVIDSGFVSAERMMADINKTKWTTARDTPERMFQGTEQRARLSLFLDMVDEGGTNAKQIAEKVRDTLYDYSFSSKANREIRKWLPFAQFTFQAIPREGKKLLNNPAAISAVANLYGQDEENPVPEWMGGRAHVTTGKNSALTGLGLPLESLTSIPNLTGGSAHESVWDLLNQSAPIVKTGVGFIADRDPFTGAAFGGTQKLPFAKEQSDLGRIYRIAEGTGLLQGFTGPIQTAETLTKPGRSTASAASQVFLGPTVREFDPVQAEAKLLEKRVTQNPEAQKKSFTTFTAREGAGEDTVEMISELRAMQRQLQQAAKARKAKATEGTVRSPVAAQ